MMDTRGFYDVTAANVVSWILIIIAFVSTQWVTVKLLSQRMNNLEDWRKNNEREARDRDLIIKQLELTSRELLTLVKTSMSRLELLERREHKT